MRGKLLWIVAHREGFRNITDLGLQAGLAKATLHNRLLAAELLGEEPVFEIATLTRVAGRARVSLGWLMGTEKSPDAKDIPPEPPEPTGLKRKRLGKIGDIGALEARVAALETQVQRLLKQA